MSNLKGVTVQNLVACDLYITTDTTIDDFSNLPTTWDEDTTQLWAKFDGDLNAGNITEKIQYLLDNVKQIKVKRTIKDKDDWTTLRVYNIDRNKANLLFSFDDNTAAYGVEYTYAVVYVDNTGSESEYITTDIFSTFSGVFIGDIDTTYHFIADIKYGDVQRHQNVGVFEPLGRKYPIYVSNAETNYSTGNFSGKIIGNYLETDIINTKEIIDLSDSLLDFLTNKRPKFIKDDNGNIWLVVVTGEPSISYTNDFGRKLQDISFDWSEVGDADDLEGAGMVRAI